jgi:hypothetical protein
MKHKCLLGATAIATNGSGICVCYFGLQTLSFQHKLNSQNNSTNALLAAGAVN